MRKTIGIIGLSRFGLNLVENLSKLDIELIGIDHNKMNVSKASDYIQNVLIADSTNEDSLRESGIINADQVIIAIGQNERANLATSIITIIKLKQLGVKSIIARADDEDSAKALKLVGADEVILPLTIASDLIANRLAATNIIDYFNIDNDFSVIEFLVRSNYPETKITELNLRTSLHLNILIISRDGEKILPNKDSIIKPGDLIYAFGRKKEMNKITAIFS